MPSIGDQQVEVGGELTRMEMKDMLVLELDGRRVRVKIYDGNQELVLNGAQGQKKHCLLVLDSSDMMELVLNST